MVVLIWFVVIDDSESDEGYVHTGVDNDDTLSIHDGSGKPFVIGFSYKNCNSVGKKWFQYGDVCKSFLMLLSSRNCV